MVRKPLDLLSPAYRRRIERAETMGKTRQQARGHKVQEHVYRKERELKENSGLTLEQVKRVIAWYEDKFDPLLYKNFPGTERVLAFAQQVGYERFKEYRVVWERARRKYLKENGNGTYASRGLAYLHELHVLAKLRRTEEVSWLYYH